MTTTNKIILLVSINTLIASLVILTSVSGKRSGFISPSKDLVELILDDGGTAFLLDDIKQTDKPNNLSSSINIYVTNKLLSEISLYSTKVKAIDRSQFIKLKKELKLKDKGFLNEETTVEIGNELGITHRISGTFKFKDLFLFTGIQLNLSVVNIETGEQFQYISSPFRIDTEVIPLFIN